MNLGWLYAEKNIKAIILQYRFEFFVFFRIIINLDLVLD